MYRCIKCGDKGNYQLKRHLLSHPGCFRFYQERFQVNDWDSLNNKLLSLTRSSYASRRGLKRQLLNAAFQAKKKDTKTVTTSINEFKKLVSLSNFRHCVLCSQFQLSSSSVEIKNTDALYETLDLDNKRELRRQNKYWICTNCKSSGKKFEEIKSIPKMKAIEIDGYQIFYPTNDNQFDDVQIRRDSLVLIPQTVTNDRVVQRNLSICMYNNQNLTNTFLSTLYDMRLSKFVQRKLYSELYEGEILEHRTNKLQSVAKVVDTSMIRASSSWKSKRRNSIHSNFLQYGQSCIGFREAVN